MRAIMISIKPEWCEKILNGKKTIEIRKTKPKCELPIKVYIYCTKPRQWLMDSPFTVFSPEQLWWQDGKLYNGKEDSLWNPKFEKPCFLNGKVVAEFMLKKVDKFSVFENGSVQNWNCFDLEKSCLTYDEIADYIGYGKTGYAWHIDDLKIYDEPKNIKMFKKPCISPQMPYCPNCKVGCECISESEQECYRAFGECSTEWVCLNYMDRPPQSWCYVEELREWL